LAYLMTEVAKNVIAPVLVIAHEQFKRWDQYVSIGELEV
jgi:hypothetical protein